MMTNPEGMILFGVGNEFRRDDGVGIRVVRRLRGRLPDGIEVVEVSSEGTAVLPAWEGAGAVILVDAVQSGARPGSIHRFEAHSEPIPTRFIYCSSHAFNAGAAVELARSLNQLPPIVIVYGIEGRDFSIGPGLSREIESVVKEVERQILEEVTQILSRRFSNVSTRAPEF